MHPAEFNALLKRKMLRDEVIYRAAAIVATTIANRLRAKDESPYKVDDFIPQLRPKKQQTVEEMIAVAKQWTLALGGEVKPNGKGRSK